MRKNKYSKITAFDAGAVAGEYLKVSYEYIDWNSEAFFFHGMEIGFYQKFFDCISTIEKSQEREITEQTHHRLLPKSIFNTNVAKHKDKATVKCFSPEETMRLKGVIQELQEENAELYEALSEIR